MILDERAERSLKGVQPDLVKAARRTAQISAVDFTIGVRDCKERRYRPRRPRDVYSLSGRERSSFIQAWSMLSFPQASLQGCATVVRTRVNDTA